MATSLILGNLWPLLDLHVVAAKRQGEPQELLTGVQWCQICALASASTFKPTAAHRHKQTCNGSVASRQALQES